MSSSILNDPMHALTTGFLGLVWGALGVMYAKHLEVGSRSHPRTNPHPLCSFIRFGSAVIFFGGLCLIGVGGWFLMTHTAVQK
ncbi:MAG: hypothetical protein ACRD3N_08000 [Terracidiphilus sp.]